MANRFHRYQLMTDLHLGHDEMVKLCSRPVGFEQRILANITSDIRPGDTFICLGDVAFYKDLYWNELLMNAIPAGVKRWLIRGNHDSKSIPWYLARGWDCVAERLDIDMYGYRIALSHRPLPVGDTGYDINIHGHLHITNHHPECEVSERHRLICCEHHYAPQLLRTIIGK